MIEEHNLLEVFKFDEAKLPELRERLKRKTWKILLPVFIGVISLDILVNQMKDIVFVSFLTFTMMILFGIITNMNLNKIINEYRKYRILVSDKSIISIFCIEKGIEWKNARLKVNDSGEITILNLELNWLRRFYDERGTIVIPPELENYEKLKLLVFKKAKTA